MDPTRFDRLTKMNRRTARLAATPFSRRAALRYGGAGVVASTLAAAGLLRTATAQQATPQASPPTAPDVTRQGVLQAIDDLDAVVSEAQGRTGVPGLAVAIVYQDEVLALHGYGEREAGGGDQVDAETVFQLASVSKPIASTVVAGLVGDGVVQWDSRLVELDPTFEMYDPWVTREVTVRDMFAHRSGLPDHAGDLLEDIGYDRDEVLFRLRYQQPASSFRSAYHYTNFGLTAAAVAVARAAGTNWEDLSAERLYRPLGMDRTSSRFADYVAPENRVHGHVLVDGTWTPQFVRDPDAQSPAGGVSSSVQDLAQWLRLQLGDGAFDGQRVIAADALAETHRPQVISQTPEDPATDRASFYGLGWNVSYDERGRVRLSHSGAFALGAATAVHLLPADGLGIAVLTNAAPFGVPEAVALSFLDLAQTGGVQHDYLALLGPAFAAILEPPYGTDVDYTTQPAPAAPARDADAYVGVYDNDLFGEIEIDRDNNELVLRLGPALDAFPLHHYDGDVFVYQPVGENAGGLSAVTFMIAAGGAATRVVIENLDVDGQGTFTRR